MVVVNLLTCYGISKWLSSKIFSEEGTSYYTNYYDGSSSSQNSNSYSNFADVRKNNQFFVAGFHVKIFDNSYTSLGFMLTRVDT